MAILDILPDPNNKIMNSGKADNTNGTAGPGFASVQLTSDAKIMRTRTNSGRLIARGIAGHKWKINISYNPMTRAEFEPVYNFLLQKRGGLIPFYVSLPQYRTPQDSDFATHAASKNMRVDDIVGGTIESNSEYPTGSTQILLNGQEYDGLNDDPNDGAPTPGDLFTVLDAADSNHTKAYMVVRCETPVDYNTVAIDDDKVKVHITPPLVKSIPDDSYFVFHQPLIKVVLAKDLQQYSLNTNNLYKFSLNLEEAQ
jgi:hypothetical protein